MPTALDTKAVEAGDPVEHLPELAGIPAPGFRSISPEGDMAQRIYKLWQGRLTEAWHQLPQEEQQRLLNQVMEALNTAGGKELVVCDAAWCNERWPFFGLEEFPDVEAVQRHEQMLVDLNWSRYMDSRTILGTQFALPASA